MKSREEWITDKYILIMLSAFPLWTGFSGYSALTASKFAFFTGATAIWLIGLIVFAVRDKLVFRLREAAQWAALFFISAACLSAAFSPYGSAVILGASRYDGLLTFLLYGCILLGVSAYGKPQKAYIYSLALSSSICCIIAVFQLLGYNPFGLFPDGLDYFDSGYKYSGAFLGTIGNTDVLAAFLSLCIPLFVAAAISSGNKRDTFLLIPAALCLYILIRSGVSSGILAVGASALFAFPYLVSVRCGKRKPTLIACAISAAVIAAGFIFVYFWRGTEGTLYELSQIMHGNIDDSFGSSRILIWRETLKLIGERPLLGGGPDTLILRTELGFSRLVEETGITLSNRVDNAHNEYLGYLVNLGFPGLLAYIFLAAATLLCALRMRQKKLIPAFGCALLCYLIQSFFGLGLCLVVPLVWIFMGLINSSSED